MHLDAEILSRIQFAFVVSFHVIFPAFTIGLAAWLATIETARFVTGNPVYRRVFDFWIKIFAVSFGIGVVTGTVMAFQFGTNWGVLAERTGPIQGPLLAYEAFTAFMLEATFFGVLLTLGTIMWPYMIPYHLTVANVAAPDASLRFLVYAGAVALPLVVVYTIGVYWIFRGELGGQADYS